MATLKRRVASIALAAAALTIAILAWCWGLTSQQAQAAQQQSERLTNLLTETHATLLELVKQQNHQYTIGRASLEPVIDAEQDALRIELELQSDELSQIATLKKYLAEARSHEEHAEERLKVGRGSAADALLAKANRLKVQIALVRAKGE